MIILNYNSYPENSLTEGDSLNCLEGPTFRFFFPYALLHAHYLKLLISYLCHHVPQGSMLWDIDEETCQV